MVEPFIRPRGGAYCGARTRACRVHIRVNDFSVGTIANTARTSACATHASNHTVTVSYLAGAGSGSTGNSIPVSRTCYRPLASSRTMWPSGWLAPWPTSVSAPCNTWRLESNSRGTP